MSTPLFEGKKVPRRKRKGFIGRFDPNKKQTIPRGYDGKGYAAGVYGGTNVVGFTPVGDVGGAPSGDGGAVMGSVEGGKALQENATTYKYSCLMGRPSDSTCQWIEEWVKKNIPESEMYVNPDTGMDGIDNDYLAQLQYGITDSPDQIIDTVNASKSEFCGLELDKVDRIDSNPEFDVIVIKLKNTPNIPLKSEPVGSPVIPLAYVKKGVLESLNGNKEFVGMKDNIESFIICDKSGEEIEF